MKMYKCKVCGWHDSVSDGDLCPQCESPGVCVSKISKNVKSMSSWSIERIQQKTGLRTRQDIKKQVICQYQDLHSISKVGKNMGVSKQTILNWLHLWNIPMRSRGGDNSKGRTRESRFTLFYEYDGRSYHLTELVKFSQVKKHTLYLRLHKGWTVKAAVEAPANTNRSKAE